MITGLGIGLLGFGLILAYAGVTGQKLGEELRAVFTGQTPVTAGRNQQAAAALAAGQTFTPARPPVASNPLPAGIRPGTDTGNILR